MVFEHFFRIVAESRVYHVRTNFYCFFVIAEICLPLLDELEANDLFD